MSTGLTVLLLTLALLALVAIVLPTALTGMSPMPSSREAARVITRVLVERGVEGPVVDLGSGWGTLLRPLSRALPGPVQGWEVSPLPWLWSRLTVRGATVRLGSFHGADLREARAVVCYLSPEIMKKLRPKLEAELPVGAVVVSNAFGMWGWEVEEEVRLSSGGRVYVYVRPVR